jgi:GNAT superfamily N-acetyltransferase
MTLVARREMDDVRQGRRERPYLTYGRDRTQHHVVQGHIATATPIALKALNVRRDLGDGYELDDDRGRIDREAVHRYLSEESYWAAGRSRAVMDELIETAERVVGLYYEGQQVGFTRTLSDGHTQSYLADVYVLEEHRRRGLGVELVRFSVDEGPFAATKWLLHTADAHDLYRKFGFTEPGDRALERPRVGTQKASGV